MARDPLKAQEYKTQRAALPEDVWQPLYDRVNIATTLPGQVSFFSVPKGQTATLITGTATAVIAKSYRDTNIETANVVPTKMFKFVGISLGFVHLNNNLASNTTSRNMVTKAGYLQFRIVDKDLLFIPLIAIPYVNPFAAVATTTGATDIMADNPGAGQGIGMYKLPIPITLNPYENFSVTLNFTTAASVTIAETLDVYVILQGFQRRPT